MARTDSSNILIAMEDGTFFVENETPVGTINGTNDSFTLADTPNPTTSLIVFLGIKLSVTEDYTLSGDTLTMGTAPPTGAVLRVNYRVEPA